MKTAIINFKVDPELKAKAKKRAKKLGVPLSTVLHTQLYSFAEGGTVAFPAEPSTSRLDALLEKSLASGTVGPFDDTDAAIKYLSDIGNDD